MTDLLAAFVASTDQVVLEKQGKHFVLCSPTTGWFRQLWPDSSTYLLAGASNFLDYFLVEAEQHWQHASQPPLSSGPFIENLAGKELALEARAAHVAGATLLILQNLGQAFTDNQNLLQAARENLLTQEVLEREVSKRTEEIRGRELEIAERLIYAAGFRDEETGAHIRRVGFYSAAMARAIGWNQLAVDDIKIAAPMHDIGKVGIPDMILKKPGRLDETELSVMRTHTTIGKEMLADSTVPMLCIASEIAGSHHEYWNGLGYPEGLKGEDIPVSARIVSIVDVYDALVHRRVYKTAFEEHVALEMMRGLVNIQFDPDLFAVFLDNLDEMRDIRGTVIDR